ncbi:MAG TPA: Mut7-C RNAse domain-containing protein [Terriglobia bacterium]|nr:Mut7-C RNAse domain-containing protein [Terriglobia bacterium]
MSAAQFRFYAELNDFLPAENRGKELTRCFNVSGSVKDFVESFGVPHTEVDLVLANGNPVDFSYPVRDGDRVSVYPVFESLDITSISRVRTAPLRALRFLLDVHVGRLAAYLRMAGFDALYGNQASDTELAGIVAREGRVLLTRDRYLLMRTAVDRGYWIRSAEPKQQLLEVVKRFDLAGSMRPFTRCLACNAILEGASRESVLERLPPKVMDKDVFHICPSCHRVYWEGSHHERMSHLLRWVKANVPAPPVARSRD